MRMAGGIAIAAAASLSACSGFKVGFDGLVYVGPDRIPHETFTWYGPIGNVYAADGTDPRVGRVGPGEICDQVRVVERPDYDDITTESGEPMNAGAYPRTLFKICLQPGEEIQ